MQINKDRAHKVFLISDTHFGHKNIIKYTNRPFLDVEQMNKVLVNNWNKVVGKDGSVIFLGDLAFHSRYEYWLEQLNYCNLCWIKGNHDDDAPGMIDNLTIKIDGYTLLLTHEPVGIPSRFNIWNIHGHTHNKLSYMRGNVKQVSVCVENINFQPISLIKIIKDIEENENGENGIQDEFSRIL